MIDIEYKCPFCSAVNRVPARLVTQPSTCRFCMKPVFLTLETELKPEKQPEISVPTKDMLSFPIAGWLLFLVAIVSFFLKQRTVYLWFSQGMDVPFVPPFVYIVIVTATWVPFDMRRLGFLRPGKITQHPYFWFLGCLFLWLPFFPVYLLTRDRLARAVAAALPILDKGQQATGAIAKVSLLRLPFLFLRLMAGLVMVYWAGPYLLLLFYIFRSILTESSFDIVDYVTLCYIPLYWARIWLVVGGPALLIYWLSSRVLSSAKFRTSTKFRGDSC